MKNSLFHHHSKNYSHSISVMKKACFKQLSPGKECRAVQGILIFPSPFQHPSPKQGMRKHNFATKPSYIRDVGKNSVLFSFAPWVHYGDLNVIITPEPLGRDFIVTVARTQVNTLANYNAAQIHPLRPLMLRTAKTVFALKVVASSVMAHTFALSREFSTVAATFYGNGCVRAADKCVANYYYYAREASLMRRDEFMRRLD